MQTDEDRIHTNSAKTKPIEPHKICWDIHLHTPSDDTRRTTGIGARREELYSIYMEPMLPRLPEQDTNPKQTKKSKNKA